MSSSTTPQKPSEGGNLKYIVIGLLFMGGAIGLVLLGREPAPPPPAPAPPPPPEEVERVNPMAQPELIIEEEEEPEPEPEPTPKKARKKRTGSGGGSWDCSGDVARASLSQVINENRPQVRNCYERRLKVNNVLQGDLRLKLKIGAKGSVVATSVSGSIRDNEVFACVRKLADAWNFPPPTGGSCAVVAVPFSFKPKP